MDSALYASMHVLVDDDCSMSRVCENAFMSVYPHNCDDMLLESLGVIDMDLDAKLVLANKFVDKLKCENESLKMHAKCLIVEPIAKTNENICCNQVVVPNFVPIMCSISKYKSMYIPLHKRNRKVERMTLKSKSSFRSQPKVLDGSKFVPTCHYCGVIGHISPQCHKFKREQNHVTRSFPKKPSGPKHIVCHHCDTFGHLRPYYSKFLALKRKKKKRKEKKRET